MKSTDTQDEILKPVRELESFIDNMIDNGEIDIPKYIIMPNGYSIPTSSLLSRQMLFRAFTIFSELRKDDKNE